ncbi:MAG: hypothetical protein KDK30_04110, partial [Leptospiraceae bacterium]|nr:hypothetical protein [Leptospiraceae bacterium]
MSSEIHPNPDAETGIPPAAGDATPRSTGGSTNQPAWANEPDRDNDGNGHHDSPQESGVIQLPDQSTSESSSAVPAGDSGMQWENASSQSPAQNAAGDSGMQWENAASQSPAQNAAGDSGMQWENAASQS